MMNDDCPENITLEECLKRKLTKSKVKSASSSNAKVSTEPKISQTKFQELKISSSSIGKGAGISSSGSGSNVSVPPLKLHNNNHASNTTSSSPKSSSGSSGGGHGGGGGGFASKSLNPNYSNAKSTSPTNKGGVVVNCQTVVVKSNFEMAGRLNKSGKRPNAKAVGSHASASLNYMNNHGANDLEKSEELSNTFDAEGNRMGKEEFEAVKEELNEGVGAFRRIVIDAGQEFEREEMNRLVNETMQTFQEQTGKQFDYTFAVHNDTEHIHAHVLAYGQSSEINMTKEHLQLFKEIAGEKTLELVLEKELDQDRQLSFHQQIDKAMDGVLDNHEEQTHKASLSL
jgi:RNase P protein component